MNNKTWKAVGLLFGLVLADRYDLWSNTGFCVGFLVAVWALQSLTLEKARVDDAARKREGG